MKKLWVHTVFIIYNFVCIALLPYAILKYHIRSFRYPGYRKRFFERFGFVGHKIVYKFDTNLKKDSFGLENIWLNTLSLGEFKTAIPLLKRILSLKPEAIVTITTTTPTGSEEIIKFIEKYPEYKLQHIYTPFDYWICVRLFLSIVKPTTVIIVETGIWPNTIQQIKKFSRAKLYLVNAGMSPRSRKKHLSKLLHPVAKHFLQNFDKIYSRSELDYEFYQTVLGDTQKVRKAGNLKCDIEDPPLQFKQGKVLRNKFFHSDNIVIVGSSTHEGEESIILNAYRKLIQIYGEKLKLILAPRHPERFNIVFDLIKDHKCYPIKFSQNFNTHTQNAIDQNFDCSKYPYVYLANEMGEMYKYFGMADVVIVCGSFVPGIGGHNVLEPAVCQLPIITGQYVFNNKQIVEEMVLNKAIIIHRENDLFETLNHVLGNQNKLKFLGENAYQFVKSQRGTTERILSDIM